MIFLNQSYELLTGGFYIGNNTWSKSRTEIDNCFKLYQLKEGEVSINAGGLIYLLKPNKLYFINGFKINEQFCKKHFVTYWLHFIPKDLMTYHKLQSMPAVIEMEDHGNLLTTPYSIANFLDYERQQSNSFLPKLHFQNLLSNIVLRILTDHPTPEILPSSTLLRIEPAIQYINTHYKQSIKLEDLAQICCMSPNYFHKRFKEALNVTPANYQTVLKMNAALQMLASAEIPIKNIASELGFVDNAHFTKTFKTHYGISPKAYRDTEQESTLAPDKEMVTKTSKIFC